MKRIFTLLVAVFASYQSHSYDPMYSDYAATIGSNVFNLFFDYNHFSTQDNIDGEGNKIPLPENDSFSKQDIDLFLKYGVLENFDVLLGFRFRVNDSVEQAISKTTYGEERFNLGLKYNFINNLKWSLALELSLAWTFYKNTEAQKELVQLVLGDPGPSILFDVLGAYKISKYFKINGLLGFHAPPNNLSGEMLYDLRLVSRFSYFMASVGFGGIISFNTDIFDSFEHKQASHGFYTGGSNLFYSFNRQLFAPYASISALLWETMRVQFRIAQNVSGRSTDTGTTLGFNLLFNFGSGTKIIQKKEKPPSGKMVQGKILKFTAENKFAKLNLGTSADIKKGMKVFFYNRNKIEDVLIARGVIFKVGVKWSIAKVEKYFQPENVKKGSIVKVLLD